MESGSHAIRREYPYCPGQNEEGQLRRGCNMFIHSPRRTASYHPLTRCPVTFMSLLSLSFLAQASHKTSHRPIYERSPPVLLKLITAGLCHRHFSLSTWKIIPIYIYRECQRRRETLIKCLYKERILKERKLVLAVFFCREWFCWKGEERLLTSLGGGGFLLHNSSSRFCRVCGRPTIGGRNNLIPTYYSRRARLSVADKGEIVIVRVLVTGSISSPQWMLSLGWSLLDIIFTAVVW